MVCLVIFFNFRKQKWWDEKWIYPILVFGLMWAHFNQILVRIEPLKLLWAHFNLIPNRLSAAFDMTNIIPLPSVRTWNGTWPNRFMTEGLRENRGWCWYINREYISNKFHFQWRLFSLIIPNLNLDDDDNRICYFLSDGWNISLVKRKKKKRLSVKETGFDWFGPSMNFE